MMFHFVHLLRSGDNDVAKVTVYGDNKSAQTHRVKRFLDLNRVPYKSEPQTGPDVKVQVGETEKNNPGPLELARLLKFPGSESSAKGEYDVVVVGGGPAGMSAAVCASGMGLNTLVLEDDAAGGQAGTSINRVENYFGFPSGVAAQDLMQRGLNQAFNLNVVFLPGLRATSFEACEGTWGPRYRVGWTTGEQKGDVTAGVVVIATGRVPRRVIGKGEPGAANETRFTDRGLYYDALPKDAENVEGKKIAIIGAGDAAGRAAVMFAQSGAKVTLIVRNDFSMGQKLKDEVMGLVKKREITLKQPFTVTNFRNSSPKGTYLEIVDIQEKGKEPIIEVPVDRAYALTGGEPGTKWLKKQGPKLDKKGFVLTEVPIGSLKVLPMQTSIPGVFAIGDVRSPGIVQRIAQAAGQGAAVAVSIDLYLRGAPAGVLADETSPAFAFYGPLAADSPVTVPTQSPAPADARVKTQRGLGKTTARSA
jgi:thioredoxin reductase (NADPH)